MFEHLDTLALWVVPCIIAFGQYVKQLNENLKAYIPIGGFVFCFLLIFCAAEGREMGLNIYQICVYCVLCQLAASGGYEVSKFMFKK